MKTIYVDESGSPSPNDGDKFLIVTALIAKSERAVTLQVKRARRRVRIRTAGSELKASRSRPVTIKRLLHTLARSPNEIVALIVDKQGIPSEQAEIMYKNAIGYVIQHCICNYPHAHIYIDRRYTNRKQTIALENAIRQQISDIPDQIVIINQVDSTAYPGLQAVDFVAWAFREKYEHGTPWTIKIISHQVILEKRIQGSKLAALPGGR